MSRESDPDILDLSPTGPYWNEVSLQMYKAQKEEIAWHKRHNVEDRSRYEFKVKELTTTIRTIEAQYQSDISSLHQQLEAAYSEIARLKQMETQWLQSQHHGYQFGVGSSTQNHGQPTTSNWVAQQYQHHQFQGPPCFPSSPYFN